jgi:hypothetical protein
MPEEKSWNENKVLQYSNTDKHRGGQPLFSTITAAGIHKCRREKKVKYYKI